MHGLIKNCIMEDGKMYMFVSSITQHNKKVGPALIAIMCVHIHTLLIHCVCLYGLLLNRDNLSPHIGTDSTLEVV